MLVDLEVRPEEVEAGFVNIEILSASFTPSDHGLTDGRELGMVLSRVEYEPRKDGLDGSQGGP
jgi:hypothetical protein